MSAQSMRAAPRAPRVVLVTDPAYSPDALARAVDACAAALPPGALCVQLRDKRADGGRGDGAGALPASAPAAAERARLARALRASTRARGQLFVVNGDLALARAVGADGAHLGGGAPSVRDARAALGERAWISVAAHSDADAARAAADGADALLVSPIFASPGKGPPRGVDALRAARAAIGRARVRPLDPQPPARIYALGGVDASNARACADAGADGLAVIRAVLAAPDPAAAIRALYAAILSA